MPAFEWVHVQLHQQKGMISLSPPTICNSARRSTYKMLDKRSALYKAKRKIEKAKAQVRAKVEPPFRVIKRQFGYTKVRFRGLVRNTAQLVTLFALSNLWMARRHLLASAGEVRL
ncbi:transposase [Citrobacter farmeri]|uniref:transposase n=1 Tax=Citrobacter farmeri TaxID=67824 RepID=UPI00292F6B05|nr:transposase [Citrobacter farmeri]